MITGTPTLGSNGWYKSFVDVEYDCDDGESGIDFTNLGTTVLTCPETQQFTEGENHNPTVTVFDFGVTPAGGNSATAQIADLDVDVTNVALTMTSPSNGDVFRLPLRHRRQMIYIL